MWLERFLGFGKTRWSATFTQWTCGFEIGKRQFHAQAVTRSLDSSWRQEQKKKSTAFLRFETRPGAIPVHAASPFETEGTDKQGPLDDDQTKRGPTLILLFYRRRHSCMQSTFNTWGETSARRLAFSFKHQHYSNVASIYCIYIYTCIYIFIYLFNCFWYLKIKVPGFYHSLCTISEITTHWKSSCSATGQRTGVILWIYWKTLISRGRVRSLEVFSLRLYWFKCFKTGLNISHKHSF